MSKFLYLKASSVVLICVGFFLGFIAIIQLEESQEASAGRYVLTAVWAQSHSFSENVHELATEKLSDGYLTNGEFDEVNDLVDQIAENNYKIERQAIIREFKKY